RQIMDQAGSGEGEDRRQARPQPSLERPEEQRVGKVMERAVPPAGPQLGERGGPERGQHDRLRVDTRPPPDEGEEVEGAEVEEEAEAGKHGPATKARLAQGGCEAPEDGRPQREL